MLTRGAIVSVLNALCMDLELKNGVYYSWIEVCRKNHPFSGNSSYTDDYLDNMKTLTRARNMLRDVR